MKRDLVRYEIIRYSGIATQTLGNRGLSRFEESSFAATEVRRSTYNKTHTTVKFTTANLQSTGGSLTLADSTTLGNYKLTYNVTKTMAYDGQDQNDIIRGKRPCHICQRDIVLTTNGCFRFHKFRGSRCAGSGEGFGSFDNASKNKVRNPLKRKDLICLYNRRLENE
ncbi:hypothetical protein GJ496_002768 [Pomphorhynchus laevis]|nr:hypothetical protein GJ496_002768 [Pomphorhynchus laevis]